MLGITQNAEGGFKFVIGEGYSKKGPIPPTGNTNTRGFFEPTTKEFVKKEAQIDITFEEYPKGSQFLPGLRQKALEIIEANIK